MKHYLLARLWLSISNNLMIILSALIITGLAISFFSGEFQSRLVKNKIGLYPSSPIEPMWEGQQLQFRAYLFNVSNAFETVQGAKPILNEVGPFHWDFHLKKDIIDWNDNGTVTYELKQTYKNFRSDLDPNIPVTMINVPATALVSAASKSGLKEWTSMLLDMLLKTLKETDFTSQLPEDIIMNGYNDNLLKFVYKTRSLGVDFPITSDKFGFLYRPNKQNDIYNLFDGTKNSSLALKLNSLNFLTKTKFHPDKCGEIRGNVDMFPPLEGPAPIIELFSADMYRPIILHKVGTAKVKGVTGVRYEVLPSFFANKTVNEDNWCFEGAREWPSGIFDGNAVQEAPMFLSQPHFFQADPAYLSQFANGSLKPDPNKHQTYFVIDPVSGVPLEMAIRLQINVPVQFLEGLSLFESFKEPVIFPAFWFEVKMEISDEFTNQLWYLLNAQRIISWIGLSICVVPITFLLHILWKKLFTKKKALYNSEHSTTEMSFGSF